MAAVPAVRSKPACSGLSTAIGARPGLKRSGEADKKNRGCLIWGSLCYTISGLRLFLFVKLKDVTVSHQQFKLFPGANHDIVEVAHAGTGRDEVTCDNVFLQAHQVV